MAKKRKQPQKPRAAKPAAAKEPVVVAPPRVAPPAKEPVVVAPPRVAPPAKEPVFWFGFEVAWAKLLVARFVIFTLLAIDAVMQVSHAPRYGAGDFNVGQLPFLEAIAPNRMLYGATQLVLAYVFVTVAFGVATRVLVPLAAVLYAWLYFGSQLDSYQHHYLVVVMLAIASFVPWQRPADANPRTPVRTWAVRLLLVQLAIMYAWAGVSKIDTTWLDGTTLSLQMSGKVGTFIRETIGFGTAAVLVVVAELGLAATVWSRPGWKIAAPLGLAFHLGIVFTGLEIGLFAFLMLGIYVLVLPEALWIRFATKLEGPARVLGRRSWPVFGAGLVVGLALAKLVRLEDAFVVGVATCLVPLGVAILTRRPAVAVGIAPILAIGLWLVADRATSVTEDYYRYWGGSQRRIGSPETAEYAYRRLTEIVPDKEPGHFQLGRLLVKRGALEEGLAELREAQRLAPAVARAFVEEARALAKQGKTAEAIEKAKQATYADPSHAQARALLGSLTGGAKAPAVDDDSE